jgi:Tol biopolymer transport system component
MPEEDANTAGARQTRVRRRAQCRLSGLSALWTVMLLSSVAQGCDGSRGNDGEPIGSRAEPSQGLIIFSRGFRDDLYAMAPIPESRVRRLTTLPGGQFDPSWSPDGLRIVFRDSRAGVNNNDEIYVMRAGGSLIRNLTHNPANDWSPAWSPDGTQVVFASTRADGQLALWTMRADGTDPRRITAGVDEYPTWSPNGAWIAYGHGLPQSDVWLVRPDGTDAHPITDSTEPEWLPAWSPDGKRIAYVRGYEGRTTLWLMNADGSGQHPLTRANSDMGPAWAPDGAYLVFSRNGVLHIIDPDGQGVRSLGVEGVLPSWGPAETQKSG